MSSSASAILQTVALDPFHCRLLGRMLALLNPRLHRCWSTSESERGDAILVDMDKEEGRRYAEAAIDEGLGARLIALGNGATSAAGPLPACQPLRLDTLLAALSRIEAAPLARPVTTEAPLRYHLLEWPAFDGADAAIGATPLRICALLARQPLGIRDIASLLGLDPTEVYANVDALSTRGLLLAEDAPEDARSPAQPQAPATSPLRRLAAGLRRRLGL